MRAEAEAGASMGAAVGMNVDMDADVEMRSVEEDGRELNGMMVWETRKKLKKGRSLPLPLEARQVSLRMKMGVNEPRKKKGTEKAGRMKKRNRNRSRYGGRAGKF
jgi:hypothetical protein